jgi:hypothetical protein
MALRPGVGVPRYSARSVWAPGDLKVPWRSEALHLQFSSAPRGRCAYHRGCQYLSVMTLLDG